MGDEVQDVVRAAVRQRDRMWAEVCASLVAFAAAIAAFLRWPGAIDAESYTGDRGHTIELVLVVAMLILVACGCALAGRPDKPRRQRYLAAASPLLLILATLPYFTPRANNQREAKRVFARYTADKPVDSSTAIVRYDNDRFYSICALNDERQPTRMLCADVRLNNPAGRQVEHTEWDDSMYLFDSGPSY